MKNFGETWQLSGVDSYKVPRWSSILIELHLINKSKQKLWKGDLVRGIDKVKVEALEGCDFCKVGKLTQKPHPERCKA